MAKKIVFITFVYVLKVTSWKLKTPVKYSVLEPYVLYTLLFFLWFFLWTESILDFSVFANGHKIRKNVNFIGWPPRFPVCFSQPCYTHCSEATVSADSQALQNLAVCAFYSLPLFVFPLFNYVFNNILKKGSMTTTFEYSRIAPFFMY